MCDLKLQLLNEIKALGKTNSVKILQQIDENKILRNELKTLRYYLYIVCNRCSLLISPLNLHTKLGNSFANIGNYALKFLLDNSLILF